MKEFILLALVYYAAIQNGPPANDVSPYLTIHGGWPQYQNSSYPSNCNGSEFNIEEISKLLPEMEYYWRDMWPNSTTGASPDNSSIAFWAHEWSKHGTCTGLSQYEYFSSVLKANIATDVSRVFTYLPPGYLYSIMDMSRMLAYLGLDGIPVCGEELDPLSEKSQRKRGEASPSGSSYADGATPRFRRKSTPVRGADRWLSEISNCDLYLSELGFRTDFMSKFPLARGMRGRF